MVLEQEPPSGRYFGTVPVGVSACPLMPGLPYAGGAAVSWLYAVDSLGLVPLTGMHRGGFTRLEMYRFPALTGRYPYDYRGGVKQGAHAPPQAIKYMQANTGGRRRPGAEPSRPSSPGPPRQLVKTATSEHRIQGGKE